MSHTIHFTESQPYWGEEGRGWVYACPHCAYQARFLSSGPGADGRLEVISRGNRSVRHVDRPEGGDRLARPVHTADTPAAEDAGLSYEDQAVLMPHLERQIVDILRRADQNLST